MVQRGGRVWRECGLRIWSRRTAWVGIVVGEIGIDRDQVGDRAEDATADALPRHFREEVLDRVEPGGRGWGK
jgi:hypothetical protein